MWRQIFRSHQRLKTFIPPICEANNFQRIIPQISQHIKYISSIQHNNLHDTTLHETVKIKKQTFRTEGALTIDEVFEHLQKENAIDIVVINLPEEACYVDYFIVVSGFSERHLESMAELTNKLYKSKKQPHHPFSAIEGKDASDNWISLDIGNIVIHFMLPETREEYQLEKLWLLGHKHDDLLRETPDQAELMQQMLSGKLNLMSMNQDIIDAIDDVSFWDPEESSDGEDVKSFWDELSSEPVDLYDEEGNEFKTILNESKTGDNDNITLPGTKDKSKTDDDDSNKPFVA